MTHETLDGPGSGVAESADSSTLDLFATKRRREISISAIQKKKNSQEMRRKDERAGDVRELEKHVNFALMTSALNEPVHHVHHPSCTLTTRCTLTAGLVFIEL